MNIPICILMRSVFLYIVLSITISFCCQAQGTSPFDGNGVFEMISQPTTSKGMTQFKTYLEQDREARFSETAWLSKQRGLEIGLKYESVIRVFVHGQSPYSYGMKPYEGAMPLGLNYVDTESSIVAKLGSPAEKKSWGALIYYVSHKGQTYYTCIEMNDDRGSIKYVFIRKDTKGNKATISSNKFGGKGKSVVHVIEKKSTGGGNIEMLESFKDDETGCVKGDCKNGTGTYVWTSGNRYIGEFKNGLRHGFGSFYFDNGDFYIGEWKANEQSGYGVYEYATKGKYQKYMGQWVNGKRQGFGYMILKNGITNIGVWRNGAYQVAESERSGCLSGNCQSGKSIYVWPDDGSRYIGAYTEGKRNGYGVYHYAKGGSYEGNFVNGMRSGKGTYYFPNGSKYVGAWENDQRNGYGEMFRKDGEIVKGIWKNGKLVKKNK